MIFQKSAVIQNIEIRFFRRPMIFWTLWWRDSSSENEKEKKKILDSGYLASHPPSSQLDIVFLLPMRGEEWSNQLFLFSHGI
jgi:hypothetical protein